MCGSFPFIFILMGVSCPIDLSSELLEVYLSEVKFKECRDKRLYRKAWGEEWFHPQVKDFGFFSINGSFLGRRYKREVVYILIV